MRRRLAALALATTGLVVLALLLPLALLVRRQATDRAQVAAEREARAVASLVALAVAGEAGLDAVPPAIGELAEGTIVVLPRGPVVGDPLPGQGTLAPQAAAESTTVAREVPGGWELALPVIGRSGTVVVDVFVPDRVLEQGVAQAWLLLAALGLVLVTAAILVADRLGRRLVTTIKDLSDAAKRMAQGDLEVRVTPGDPEELRNLAVAFNDLTSRLDELLTAERESVADLSHRLRTPLTSMRLQAEKIGDYEEREQVLAQVDRLERSIDQLIVDARGRADRESGWCVLDDVIAARAEFWKVLAEDQDRPFSLSLNAGEVQVPVPEHMLQTVVDSLIGNVFVHTESGTWLSISTGADRPGAWVEVSDGGAGFGDEVKVVRGRSGAGSTGLGLDIARRTAESTGGDLTIDDRPGVGAVVRVSFGGVTG